MVEPVGIEPASLPDFQVQRREKVISVMGPEKAS